MSLRDALNIPARHVTDETVYQGRRTLLRALAFAPALTAAGCAEAEPPPPPRTVVTPAQAAPDSATAEELTVRRCHHYNNFYEFGLADRPLHAARTLKTQPWSITGGGECARPGRIALEDLLKGLAPQERIYRLRCVEGWSMVIPWLGVPLGEVLKKFAPTSRAKYVAFTTLADPRQMPGIRYPSINWPYRGNALDEAMHPLTLLATGLYGKPLPQQNGAPLRLGGSLEVRIKSIKSIVESGSWKKCRNGLARPAAVGVRLLLQRQSRGRPPPLEPEDGAAHRRRCQQAVRQARAHPALQRLRRPGRLDVCRPGPEEVVLTAGSRKPPLSSIPWYRPESGPPGMVAAAPLFSPT